MSLTAGAATLSRALPLYSTSANPKKPRPSAPPFYLFQSHNNSHSMVYPGTLLLPIHIYYSPHSQKSHSLPGCQNKVVNFPIRNGDELAVKCTCVVVPFLPPIVRVLSTPWGETDHCEAPPIVYELSSHLLHPQTNITGHAGGVYSLTLSGISLSLIYIVIKTTLHAD